MVKCPCRNCKGAFMFLSHGNIDSEMLIEYPRYGEVFNSYHELSSTGKKSELVIRACSRLRL